MRKILSALLLLVAVAASAQVDYSKMSAEEIQELARKYMPSAETITETRRNYATAGDSVGIYANIEGHLTAMQPIRYTNVKANALGAALTGGIAKTKAKLIFAGAYSPYIFLDGVAHFRIYFGLVPAGKSSSHYMFNLSNSIRDFAVSKFDADKKQRTLVSASYSLFGGLNRGTNATDEATVTFTEVREGVYDVTVTAKPGEYCFLFTQNGVGSYTSVFDFSIR